MQLMIAREAIGCVARMMAAGAWPHLIYAALAQE
jgi:hypothetical protein